MQEQFHVQSLIKMMDMLHSIIKIDICLNDHHGAMIYQLINHPIPIILTKSDNTYITHIHEILQTNDDHHYYHFIDSFGLEYIAAGIRKEQLLSGSVLIGPLITSISVIDLIKDIISKNNLPIESRKPLEQFYQSLPILSDVEFHHIGELLIHLCANPHIRSQRISSTLPVPGSKSDPQKVILEGNTQMIEDRYDHQNKLMLAITKGDREQVDKEVNYLIAELVEFSDRVPGSPIRSSKNMGFVLNTMCRIAAENSGVHPVYLHNLSERYANLIERATTMPHLKKLFYAMANDYCDLVMTVSTAPYSPIVKKAVDYIMLNLGSPLPLPKIAAHIHINPSHLSRKFKSDTGMTMTDFINRKRIDEAKLYLQRGNISITDVALMVGFNDLNYFCKVFKKEMSETPSQYAKRRFS